MSFRSGVVCLITVACLWSSVALAAPDETVFAGTLIETVDAKKPRVTIGRGKKAGIKVGDKGELYPLRKNTDNTTTVDFALRIAVGKVVEVKDNTSTLALDAITDTVKPGDYFAYKTTAPAELAKSSLFRIVELGVDLIANEDRRQLVTVEQMLADPSEAMRNRVLDVMIADAKAIKTTIVDVLKDKIQQGKYHGKTAGQVVDGLSRDQLLEFFLYVEAYPNKYVAKQWPVPEIFFTWVVSGTPSGERERKVKQIIPVYNTAADMITAGKLDDARRTYQEVLKVVPDYKDALDRLKQIEQIMLDERIVAADPDDTATAYKLASELFDLGAHSMVLARLDALEKRKYEPFKTSRLRAITYVRMERFAEAEKILTKLLTGEHKDDKSMAHWLKASRAKARLKKAPNDANSFMALAEIQLEIKSWDNAQSYYRSVLTAANATAKQKEAAKQAQQLIAVRIEIENRSRWIKEYIQEHDMEKARESLAIALKLLAQVKDDKTAGDLLDDLADTARMYQEEELALELLTRRAQELPDSMAAQAALAFALLGFDRLDEADAAAKKSLERKGEPAYSYLILAYVAHSRHDFGAMEKMAEKSLAGSPKYVWPQLVLARTEAAKGNWDAALDHAKKALDAKQDNYEVRSTHIAVNRGIDAMAGLKADPKSARERLRLVRALAELGLVQRATEEIAKLPADADWRSEGWWAIASSSDARVLLSEHLTAARNAKPTTLARKLILDQYELRTKLRANPKDDAVRIALVKNYIRLESIDRALATLGPLRIGTGAANKTLPPAVAEALKDALLFQEMTKKEEDAEASRLRRDYTGALKLAKEAAQGFDRLNTSWQPIAARTTQASVYSELGKYADAIAVLQEARKITVAWGDPGQVAWADQSITKTKSFSGTSDEYKKALGESKKVCESTDAEFDCFYVYKNLAQTERDEGHTNAATDLLRKAWALADKLGRPELARSARIDLAATHLDTNHIGDAEAIASKLLVDSRAANDLFNEQTSLVVLGYVAMIRGQGKQARARFQEVYELGTRNGDNLMRAMGRRFEGAAWLMADHDPAKALASLQQADELYKVLGDAALSERFYLLRVLGDTYLQLGKLPQARKTAEDALGYAERFQRRWDLSNAQGLLALIAIKENKGDEAMKHAQAALGVAQKTDDDVLLWGAWYALAKANELKTNDAAAIDAYEKALESLGRSMQATGGDTDKAGYMNVGRVRDVYSDAVERFLKSGKTQRAMEILELSRDAVLKQQFNPTDVATKDVKLRAKLDKYEDARTRVTALQKQLDKAGEKSAVQRSDAQVKALSERIATTRAEMNDVLMDLKVQYRDHYNALAVDPQNLIGRADALPKDSVLVEYFVADDALYAFIIAANLKQPVVVRTKVTSKELETTIGDWRDAIEAEGKPAKQRDQVEALGRKLEDWILEPLRPHLQTASSVIVLPFGPLFYVPFDALVVSAPGQPVKYAVEDYRISIQTVNTIEKLLKPNPTRGSGTLLAVSNPDGTLPGAQTEVSKIVKSLPDAKVLTRNQATVKSFSELAGNYRFLHLATHGILDADPRKTYMKMSDGELTVKMIAKLQGLDTANELVVLSACDTAVEEGKSNGDELVSVAYGFAMAGSPALVASLWEVSDNSTAELMAAFYKSLQIGDTDRLEALRQAKLGMIKQGKNTAQPWHWSSFQMYGDFRVTK